MPLFLLVKQYQITNKKTSLLGGFFLGWQKEEYVERKSAQLYCILVNHRSEILEMKEQVQLIRSLLAA